MSEHIKVLVVEDTRIAQISVNAHLVGLGCLVTLVASGAEALEKAKDEHYDVILMDVGLGEGADGFEVTLLMREKCPANKDTPVFALTANDEDDNKKKAVQVGMVGLFSKPFTPQQAQEVITFVKEHPNP